MKQSQARGAAEITRENHDRLLRLLRDEALAGPHLELGTAAGGTLCTTLGSLPEDRSFVVVDPLKYFAGQREAVETNLERSGIDRRRVDRRVASSTRGRTLAR